jgi:hypothetical protein
LASQTRPSRTSKRKSLSPQKTIKTTKKATDKVRGTTKILEVMITTKEAIITRDVTNEGQDAKEIMMATAITVTTNKRIINSLEKVMSNPTIVEIEAVDKVAAGETETEVSVIDRETFSTHAKSMTKA